MRGLHNWPLHTRASDSVSRHIGDESRGKLEAKLGQDGNKSKPHGADSGVLDPDIAEGTSSPKAVEEVQEVVFSTAFIPQGSAAHAAESSAAANSTLFVAGSSASASSSSCATHKLRWNLGKMTDVPSKHASASSGASQLPSSSPSLSKSLELSSEFLLSNLVLLLLSPDVASSQTPGRKGVHVARSTSSVSCHSESSDHSLLATTSGNSDGDATPPHAAASKGVAAQGAAEMPPPLRAATSCALEAALDRRGRDCGRDHRGCVLSTGLSGPTKGAGGFASGTASKWGVSAPPQVGVASAANSGGPPIG
eukprot:CAMPEP_0115249694 /NCGR_PEP_ID=MMETSP0270-20121206/42722_1 /TAXON_ID=71861 /ORGANISM="Scrippsiella trochoidea, Strain CCMP3099" /LENGTH=308 /DNA_ID=CAMNT_0002665043 /DNA_START=115 /DNA_END=1039 /DNA_ORIENTATION=-